MPNKKINQLTPRTPTLTDLILVGDPATGYSYKATLSAMINFVGGNIQFSSLGGISLTNPTNGQVLTFNGTNWVNQTPAAAPVSSVFGRTGAVVAAEGDYSLTLLSDVTISTPTNGQVLKYNGTAWVNDSDTDTGITSLNGLTATTQTFATGTSGTDFNISSTTSTHTFNLPTASATNRGALSSSDWTTFNAKQNTITLATIGNSGAATFISNTLNIPNYTLAGLGGISLSSLSASAPLSYNSGTGAFSITQASGSTNGFLSSTDWTTFNNKQSTITLTTTGSSGASTFISNTLNIPTYTLAGLGGVSGSGTTNYVSKWTSSSALGNSQIFDNGTNVGIGTTSVSNVASERVLQLNALSFSTFRLRNDANTVTTILSNNASGWGYVGTGTNHPFLFTTNNTEKARLTAAGRLLLGTTTESTFLLDVNGTARVSGTELRLDNATTGVINLYSTTPEIRFSVGDPTNYRIYRSSTNMIINSAGAIIQQIGGNQAYTIDASNGHILRSAISGGAALARLTTGGNMIIGSTTDGGQRLQVVGTLALVSGANYALMQPLTDRVYFPNTVGIVAFGIQSPNNAQQSFRDNFTTGIQLISSAIGDGVQIGYKFNVVPNSGTWASGNKIVNFQANGTTYGVIDWDGGGHFGVASPVASSILSATSTTKGFLPPRMTGAQAEAISSPAAGLMVYANNGNGTTITSTGWWGYNGTTWVKLN